MHENPIAIGPATLAGGRDGRTGRGGRKLESPTPIGLVAAVAALAGGRVAVEVLGHCLAAGSIQHGF